MPPRSTDTRREGDGKETGTAGPFWRTRKATTLTATTSSSSDTRDSRTPRHDREEQGERRSTGTEPGAIRGCCCIYSQVTHWPLGSNENGQMISEMYPAFGGPTAETEDSSQSLEDAFHEELKELRKGPSSNATNRPFNWISLGSIACLSFCKLHPDIDPVALAKRLATDVQTSGIKRTRYAIRILPIQETCSGNNMTSLLETVEKRLGVLLGVDAPPATVCLSLREQNITS